MAWSPPPAAGQLLVAADETALPAAAAIADLWEVPERPASSPCYAWLAGEAGTVVSMRRHLVGERGMDRRAIAFMGYWRRATAKSDRQPVR